MKKIVWLGNSMGDLRAFSDEARKEAGYQLGRIQQGVEPVSWKPMPSIGAGVREIRIKVEGEWRVVSCP